MNFQKIALGSGILIGIYLVVTNATGFGRSVQAAGGVASQYVRTLQGR